MQVVATLALVLCCVASFVSAEYEPFVLLPKTTYLRGRLVNQTYTAGDVENFVHFAKAAYPRLSEANTVDRLAVMIMFNFPLEFIGGTHPRLASLVCSLNLLQKNIGEHTPLDIFIWMEERSIHYLPVWLRETFPDVVFLPIPPKSWQVPAEAGNPKKWRSFSPWYDYLNYHLMGHWRLTFAFDYARAMGYQYMLQIDDDALILQSQPFNIVEDFRERRISFARRDRVFIEKQEVVTGLPELVKYWMSSRNYLAPQGPLLSHFASGSVSGVHGEGWDRHIASASFMIFDVGFWFEPAVQDLLHLVFSTGGHLTQCWADQAVQNMLHLLFLPDQYVHRFPQTAVMHQKVHDAGVFRLMRCDRASSGESLSRLTGLLDAGVLPAFVPRHRAAAVRVIEFLAAWEVHVITKERPDFTLFRWRYDSAGCGEDTHILNDYAGFKAGLNTSDPYWAEEQMGARYAALMDIDVHPDTGMARDRCQEVLREQLLRYVEFYCRAVSVDPGRRTEQLCAGMRDTALHVFGRQLAQAPAAESTGWD